MCDFTTAAHYAQECLKMDLMSAGDDHSYAIALNNMGRALLYQKRQREAISYFKVDAAIFFRMGGHLSFGHAFKRTYDCSPSQFRSRAGEEKIAAV